MNKQQSSKGRGIEWTDYTWNPVAGCKHGCRWNMPDGSTAICYAESTANAWSAAYPQGFEHHYWRPNSLDEPLSVKQPSRVFVGSMADVFGHWVPDEQIEAILDTCRRAHWHTFQFLTKAAPRLKQFKFPSNAWIGASVPPSTMMGKPLSTDQQKRMLLTTLATLAEITATVKWMSFEPLSWDVSNQLDYAFDQYGDVLQWSVIGAATNGRTVYQPDPVWVRNAIQSLREMRTAIFFKGNLNGNTGVGNWLEEFPKRREYKQQSLFGGAI